MPDLRGGSVHPALSMGCGTCHVLPHDEAGKFPPESPKGLAAQGAELCFMCHDRAPFGKNTVHPPVSLGLCTGCHNPHQSRFPTLLVAMNVCIQCHEKGKFLGKETTHSPVAAGMCTSCHSPHSSEAERLLVPDMPRLCLKCHDRETFRGRSRHGPVQIGMCMFCHEPHQSDRAGLLRKDPPDLCFDCHRRSRFLGPVTHFPVREGMCLECHGAHAGPERFLLKSQVNLLCLSCHSDVTEERHIVAGESGKGHVLSGRKDPRRRRRRFTCASCHNPHGSRWPKLFRYKAEKPFELCKACHRN